jgi:hypothetical protein
MRLVQHNSSFVYIYLFNTDLGMVIPPSFDIEAHSGQADSEMMKQVEADSFVRAHAPL